MGWKDIVRVGRFALIWRGGSWRFGPYRVTHWDAFDAGFVRLVWLKQF